MRESMVLYRSFAEVLNELPDKEAGKIYKAITQYAMFGKEPELDGLLKGYFTLIRPQIDANNDKYANGKRGGRPTKEKPLVSENEKPLVSENAEKEKPLVSEKVAEKKPNENVNENENVNVNDKEKYKEKTAKRFTPPTEAELLDYCIAKSIDIDVEAFMDFYASKGWKVGSQPMKDWQAAVRNWARRDTARSGTKAKNNLGTFGDYKQTSTDDEWNELMQLGG